jgi:Zinc finger C-x8-C-x5-C-x3-H type (and similar)
MNLEHILIRIFVAHSRASEPGSKLHIVIERNKKTEICKKWEQGICKYGDK